MYKRVPNLAKGYLRSKLYSTLPSEYKDALRSISKDDNCSMNYVVNEIIIDWIGGKVRINKPKLKLVKGKKRNVA